MIEDFFRKLIAEELTRRNPNCPVDASEVTHEFVVRERKKLYHDARYGGFDETSWLPIASIANFEACDRQIDEFVARL